MNKSEQKDIDVAEALQCLYEYARGHRKVYGLCLESLCVHAHVCVSGCEGTQYGTIKPLLITSHSAQSLQDHSGPCARLA